METLGIAFIVVFLIIYLAALGIALASYILTSLSYHKIADRRGIQNPWLAWIPFTNYWIIGSIVDEYDARNGLQRKWRVVLLALSLAFLVGFVLMYIFMIVFCLGVIALSETGGEEPTLAMISVFFVMYAAIILIMLVGMAFSFMQMICVYKIFESTVPEKAVKYMLLYLLVPLAGPICLMLCRNKGYSVPKPQPQPVYAPYPAMPVPPAAQPNNTNVPPAAQPAPQENTEE